MVSVLKLLMALKDVTQTELSTLTGKTEASVSRWVNGVNDPSDGDAKKIANRLGVKPSLIFTHLKDEDLIGALEKLAEAASVDSANALAGAPKAGPHTGDPSVDPRAYGVDIPPQRPAPKLGQLHAGKPQQTDGVVPEVDPPKKKSRPKKS